MYDERQPTQYLTITGILYPDNRLLLQPSYLTERPEYAVEDPNSPLTVELVDEDGDLKLQYGLPVARFCTPGTVADELAVSSKVPFPTGTRWIRFLRDRLLIHELEVPRGKPEVQIEWEPSETPQGRERISWSGSHPEDRLLYYSVWYSHTDGERWLPLAVNIEETSLEVDFDALPGGRGRIGLLATDGINTVFLESPTFSLPVKPCVALIFSPEDGAEVSAGQLVSFQGQGYYLEEGTPETQDLLWESSLDGTLGEGSIVETILSSGEHQIVLVAGPRERRGETSISLSVSTMERDLEQAGQS